MVDEKVYFVPNDMKLCERIQDQKLPVYLTGTLKNQEWIINDEPCELDPDTNLHFTRVRRQLNQ